MPSTYPGALDNFPTTRAVGQGDPAADYNNTADAVNKIEAELGVDPAGTYPTVVARLDATVPNGAPTSPNADNDEFDYADGTNPTTVGWSWGNQTGATASIQSGKLVIREDNTSERNFRGLFKAFPAAGDVTFVASMGSNQYANFWGFGVMALYGTLATPTRLEFIYGRNDHITLSWRTMTGWGDAGASDRIGGSASGLIRMWHPGCSWGFTFNASTFALQPIWSPDPYPASNAFRLYGSAATPVASTRPDFYGIAVTDSSTSPAGNPLASWANFFRVNWATLTP